MESVFQEGYDLAHRSLDIAASILKKMPPSREISLALTKLEESQLWLMVSEARADSADRVRQDG
jgi:hypothetical protein